MTDIFDAQRKNKFLKSAEEGGLIADSMTVRLELIARMNKGELTLDQVQAELKRIQRNAGASGKITRAKAWREA